MTEQDRQAIEAYMDRPLDELLEELDLYAPPTKGFGDVWEGLLPTVRHILCVKGQWCEVREHRAFDDNLDVAMFAASLLLDATTEIPLDADRALMTVIAVKKGMDTLCGCGGS